MSPRYLFYSFRRSVPLWFRVVFVTLSGRDDGDIIGLRSCSLRSAVGDEVPIVIWYRQPDEQTGCWCRPGLAGWLAGWRICPIKSFALRQPCQTSVWFLSKVFDFKSLRSTYLVQGETGEWHWCVSSGMIFSCCSSMFGFEGPLTHPFARGSLSYVACPGWGAY